MSNITSFKNRGDSASEHKLAVAAVVLAQVVWGLSFLFIDVALRYTDTDVMLCIRFLLIFLITNLMALSGKWKFSFRDKKLGPLLTLGLCQAAYSLLESYGYKHSSATFAGVMLATTPIFSMVLAILLLGEYPRMKQALFSLIPIAGVILMTAYGRSLGIVQMLGVVLLTACCISSALYKTFNRMAAQNYTPFERIYLVFMIPAVLYTVTAVMNSRGNYGRLIEPLTHPAFVFAVLYLAVGCSIVTNMLVNYAAGRMSVTAVSSLTSLNTLFSVLTGIFFLHEPFTIVTLLGCAMILIGVRLVTRNDEIVRKERK